MTTMRNLLRNRKTIPMPKKKKPKEFTAWQTKVGMDANAIEAGLAATERYGLNFRETIDPFYSIFEVMEQRRKLEALEEKEEEVDIDEVERIKAIEEKNAIDDGDLLGTKPPPQDLPRQRRVYLREKARLRALKKIRKLTGRNWVTKTDAKTKSSFWYNTDTGEAIWDKPKVLLELDAMELAYREKWNAMPVKLLVRIMEYLISFPDRTSCSVVCKQWSTAATDASFVRHVLPVEMSSFMQGNRQMEHNHYSTIHEALSIAQPGDTIELGDGHYWVNEPGLDIRFPLKIVGDENDPSHVVIELSGTVVWRARGGFMEGVTFRRPRISSGRTMEQEMLRMESGARIDMVHCVLSNEGSNGRVASLTAAKGHWFDTHIKGSANGCGIQLENEAKLELEESQVINHGSGIWCRGGSHLKLIGCFFGSNNEEGISLQGNSRCEIFKSRFAGKGPPLRKETGSVFSPCQGNTAIIGASQTKNLKPILGVRFIHEERTD